MKHQTSQKNKNKKGIKYNNLPKVWDNFKNIQNFFKISNLVL